MDIRERTHPTTIEAARTLVLYRGCFAHKYERPPTVEETAQHLAMTTDFKTLDYIGAAPCVGSRKDLYDRTLDLFFEKRLISGETREQWKDESSRDTVLFLKKREYYCTPGKRHGVMIFCG